MRTLTELQPTLVLMPSFRSRFPQLLLIVAAVWGCSSDAGPETVASVGVSPGTASIVVGGSVQLSASVIGSGGGALQGRTVTWSTPNAAVAQVSATGLVTGVSAGTATITATAEGRSGTALVTVAPPPVAAVQVVPPQLSLVVGDTSALTASVRDASGNVLAGRTVTWTSGSSAVASVSATGLVTAVGAGQTQVTATSEGQSATSLVTVAPAPVAAVLVAPGQVSLEVGDTASLTATLRDARGNALTGRTVSWTTGSSAVASVSATGEVTAVGAGQTQITATSEGQSGSAQVTVSVPQPQITGVSPARLVEGATATLQGRGFATNAAGNALLVDGTPAVITAATATSIQFTVPTFDCRPARDVALALSVGSATAAAVTHPLRPAAFTNVAVGQQVVMRNGSEFCFQFDSNAGSEEYLIGVQSVSASATSLTPTTLTGAIPAGAEASRLRASLVSSSLNVLDPTAGAGRSREMDELARYREVEARLRAHEAETLHPRMREMLGGAGVATAASVPPNVQVGDRFPMRVPAFDGGSSCTQFDQIEVQVRRIGARGIFVEDLANPANGFTAQDFQTLSDFLDESVYEAMTDYFGPPSDIDGNNRIVVVATKEANRRGLSFVAVVDLFPRGNCPASNEGEIYYAFVPDPTGSFGDPAQRTNVLANARRLLPHEFTHILQFSQRRAVPGAANLAQWQIEGQAQLAEEVMGHALTGRRPGQNYGLAIAFNNPAVTDVWWYSGFSFLSRYFGFQSQQGPRVSGAPEQCTFLGRSNAPCLVPLYWYGVSWSLLRWISDHFGPSFPGGERGFHQAMIRNAGSGFAALTSVLGQPFEELLPKWAASLYVDTRVPGADPLLTMPSWDIPAIQAGLVPTAQLRPAERTFSDFTSTAQVRGGSTAYYLLSGEGRPAAAIRARGEGGAPLPADMRYWIVRMR